MENLESEDDQYKENLLRREVPELYICFPLSKCSISRWTYGSLLLLIPVLAQMLKSSLTV